MPTELDAALQALADQPYGSCYVELSPGASTIRLDGEFSRESLARLVAAWNPKIRCENGHAMAVTNGPPRRLCYCGAHILG